ncbi:Actin-Rearrangement-Inducing Factor 1 [Lonomia obliqua multiple nucleopolyhedrovirus]|uniref:Actin-Rearrangement-Inducing Factor 1 n=1 Tax=Lonomia obliqua multiple nucleopolyhedrovirus TaxID=134394 RepID=A0A126FC87_9ABAC|nr:Actin-Rearrangement-Inducing Factor 1 [Lonomia obliqua multiple nucleopolyhedrovirus]AKN81010.1 Actin-Rearrangement-Inducing Factor 1 [Lonomia obliqua multiple nucleopolyhedrovirus]
MAFNTIYNVLQTFLDWALFAIYSAVYVLAVMGTSNDKYSFILDDVGERGKLINLSGGTAILFGLWLLISVKIKILHIIYNSNNNHHRHHHHRIIYIITEYLKCAMLLFNGLTVAFWLTLIVLQSKVHKSGHVPFLDALYRNYDLNSVCWSGVNMVDGNMIIANKNCFTIDDDPIDIIIKCVSCRMIVRNNEPTFFNLKPNRFDLSIITILAIQIWNMYLIVKELRYNKYYGQQQQGDGEQNTTNKKKKEEEESDSNYNEDEDSYFKNYYSEHAHLKTKPLTRFASFGKHQRDDEQHNKIDDIVYSVPKITCICKCKICACAKRLYSPPPPPPFPNFTFH